MVKFQTVLGRSANGRILSSTFGSHKRRRTHELRGPQSLVCLPGRASAKLQTVRLVGVYNGLKSWQTMSRDVDALPMFVICLERWLHQLPSMIGFIFPENWDG